MWSDEYPIASTLACSSAMRTSWRLARTSGVSTAGFRMSPASPPVQHTSTLRTPSAAYLAVVPAPFDASSSGCACTWSRQSCSRSGTDRSLGRTPTGAGPSEREHLHRADAAQLTSAFRRPLQCVVAGQLVVQRIRDVDVARRRDLGEAA